ncbi:recombinase family protein [Bradyrhizobium symbiodeficiens]|uniref:Recombinase family protein n=1 Tax=Bradyrhizobium symbiodeficiens TaxID=1404367 RepID=A0ABX5W6I1_9BRAD|nr:recombinase family protein [Bradyrhizobium symbiodeficiens]QDF38261.1 recombinase family protein [Bradyrhizobium symbiodeficiens]
MGTALTVQKARLLRRREHELRAAQYIRMSTDRQQYSIANQMALIATYAAEHRLEIVRSYIDEGISGLRINNRHGLIDLLNDVQSGAADFANVLVRDVSRWGRFQDTDESAYYEFICKLAGVKVIYCAEVFENDGSPISSLWKNMKRLMAAEVSRDQSAKVFAGQCRVVGLGYRVGGVPGFALRRELVDASGRSRGFLERGQYKALQTDRVVLRAGPPDEIAIVRGIFRSFVGGKRETAIARELNAKGVASHRGVPWNLQMIGRILRNENYIGNTVYYRTSSYLRQRRVINGKAKWIRKEGAVEQIVPRDVFDDAQRIMESRARQHLSSDFLLKKLRVLQLRLGTLSADAINRAKGVPCAAIYERRFGSLRKAYALIGFNPPADYSYIDTRGERENLIQQLADEIAAVVPNVDSKLIAERTGGCLSLKDGSFVSLRVVRCWQHPQRHCRVWTLRRSAKLHPGIAIVIRLDEQNKEALDYILTSRDRLPGRPLIMTEAVVGKRYRSRFKKSTDLIRALKRRLKR